MQKLSQIYAEKQNKKDKKKLCPTFNEFESLCPTDLM